MARVRIYNTGTTMFRNDAVTGGYGPIDFGPVHTDGDRDYRISQRIPEDVANALLDEYGQFTDHDAAADDEDDEVTTNAND